MHTLSKSMFIIFMLMFISNGTPGDPLVVWNSISTYNDPIYTTCFDDTGNFYSVSASGTSVKVRKFNTSVATVGTSMLDPEVFIHGVKFAGITASQDGNDDYYPSDPVVRSLIVNKADQTITFNSLASKTYGDENFTLSASSNSGLPVSFSSSDESVATVSGNTVTIVGAGSTYIYAYNNGNDNYNSAIVTQELQVNKADQTITFEMPSSITFSPNDTDYILTGTASSGLSVSYSPTVYLDCISVNGTALNIIQQCWSSTVSVTAYQSGNDNYNPAPYVERHFRIDKADQTISFTTIPSVTIGETYSLSATASSNLIVYFGSSSTSVATIDTNSSSMTIVGAGPVTITASQAGNIYYHPASENQTFLVSKNIQTISYNPTLPGSFTDAHIGLSYTASASSGLTVSVSSSDESVISVSGNTITILKAGAATVTATQAGDNTYSSVTDNQTMYISVLPQTISYDPVLPGSFTDAHIGSSYTASAGSGLTVSVSSSDESIVSVSGNTFTILKAGTATVTANQAGDNTYVSVTDYQNITIADQTAPSIQLTTPNGNEIWLAQSQKTISWIASDNIGLTHWQIHYSPDSGSNWTLIDSASNSNLLSSVTMPVASISKLKVTVFDAQGNSNSDVSDDYFYLLDKPVIKDTVFNLIGGQDFVHPIPYYLFPVPDTLTVIHKPGWVHMTSDTLSGTAPMVCANDSVEIRIHAGEVSDTLKIRFNIELPTDISPWKKIKDLFSMRKVNQKILIGVNKGFYNVSVYSLDGRRILEVKEFAPHGKIMVLPIESANVFIVRLKQNERFVTKKYQVCN